MEYIGKHRDGWRVQLQRDGVRDSKTFKTKRECAQWAEKQEARKTLHRGPS